MATVLTKMMFAAVFVVAVALSGGGVSAENHHVVGGDRGWGPDLDVGSWLSGRVFRVGDKIWFKYSGEGDSIVELKNLEDFESCNLENPIRMYTDPVNHVALEKEGVRYFTSGNLDNCKNGLKLPVPIHDPSEFGPPDEPYNPSPKFGPPDEPDHPAPKFGPPDEPDHPAPEFGPPDEPDHPAPDVGPPDEPYHPAPKFGPPDEPDHPAPDVGPPDEPDHPYGPPDKPYGPPHEPVHPPPEFGPPPPRPSAATCVNGLSFALFLAGLLICYMGF